MGWVLGAAIALGPASALAQDVIDVSAQSFFPVVIAGDVGEVSCTVFNTSSDTIVKLTMNGTITSAESAFATFEVVAP